MLAEPIHFDKNAIDSSLAERLIAVQFPQWAGLPITPVSHQGWDNRTFRLGTELLVRLPSAAQYALQVEKEHRWLPPIAPELPLPIPVPLAVGEPGEGFPWPWSVYRWIEGEPATIERIADLCSFARTLAEFLVALRAVDASDGPPPGPHNFYRGAPVAVYDDETQRALSELIGEIDTVAARAVWDAALATTWTAEPVWFHGDVAFGNLMVNDGRLQAVIDFGTSGIGDPACDLVIAWTLLDDPSREVFRAVVGLDEATWARGRGWAIWKALITLPNVIETDPVNEAIVRAVIDAVLDDHARFG